MQDNTTQEIEERLSERLLGNETKNDYPENGFRIDGSRNNHVDVSATTIMEGGGDFIIDATGTRGGFGGPLQPEYRDTPFALAFLLHLGIVFFFAVTWGFSAMKQGDSASQSSGGETTSPPDSNNDYDYSGYESSDDETENDDPSLFTYLWLALFTCAISIGISALSLRVMMHHAETLIQASLIGSCGFLVAIAILFAVSGAVLLAVAWIVFTILTAWYARCVWHRIPFASSNLRTALSAIQTNGGVCAVAYGIAGVAVLWTMIWSLALVGMAYHQQQKGGGEDDANTDTDTAISDLSAPIAVCMIVSFYWTIQVFQNVLHVTVSGVVGTWWFAPRDALSVFSPAIVDSFRRATTYSFGSICMGSLLVSIIQTLETVVRSFDKTYRRSSLLACIFECILHLLSRIAIYFNRWAYCYVGLYGFDYISSGKKAMELFRAKGWTTIVTDSLVHRSLRLVAIVVASLSGIFGMLLGRALGWGSGFAVFNFIPCFLIGLSMALILVNVVLSGVDTVVVAFAEAPAEFETHHPALHSNMVQKWRQVFPDECGF